MMKPDTSAKAIAIAQPHTDIETRTRLMLLSVFLFGAMLIGVTGFAHSQTMHNAAHDSRHAMAFPCH